MAATQSKYPHLTLFCVQQVNVGCGLLLEEGSPGAERGSENEREWKITCSYESYYDLSYKLSLSYQQYFW